MLVLTRKSQEKIRIGDDIVVTVLRTKGNTVRLGIEAPHDVRVLRGEIAFDQDDSDDEVQPHTSHSRISRDERARLVPHLAAGHGPLAEMMASTVNAG